MWGTQNVKSYQNDNGYTLSDGISFYYDIGLTQQIPQGVRIPRDESEHDKCVAYITGGVKADLQYKGECPNKAKFKQSNCFKP